MPDLIYPALAIGVMALVTALLRYLPFFVFHDRRPVPKVIQYLGAVLPYGVMAMLVVYCLKSISFGSFAGFLPATVSVVVAVVLHLWKRNTLLSIIVSTACYMLLLRLVS